MMNLAQARVVDPVLTAVARAFASQSAPVADVLFPLVPVAARAGHIIKFSADSFKLVNTARAPGSNTKRVTPEYGAEKFSLTDHSLEAMVPREMIEETAPLAISVAELTLNQVQDRMALEREKQAADLARTPALYGGNSATLSGTSQWDDPTSNPFGDINDAKEAIRAKTGRKPNVLALSPKALTALRSHPKLLDRLSTASDRPPATVAQLQALFEVDRVVEGGMVYADAAGTLIDMWGRDAVLAFTTPASLQQMGSPSFGYTYQLTGYPFVEEAYWERNPKSYVIPYTDAYQPVLAGPSAGFLFQNAVGV